MVWSTSLSLFLSFSFCCHGFEIRRLRQHRPFTAARRYSSASASEESVVGSEQEQDWVSQTFQEDTKSSPKIDLSRKGTVVHGPKQAIIYDTTLRDGTQGESISASANDKLKICLRLSQDLGVDYLEAGWPGSNPKDAEFFARAQTELPHEVQQKLVAFGSTRRKNIDVANDGQVQLLLDSGTPTCCIVAKSHAWHVTDILRTTMEENTAMIRDTVRHLQEHGRTVFVDLEHFFEGYQHNTTYAIKCCQAAVEAGASCLVLCDTNGGTMPWQIQEMVQDVVTHFPDVTIGIHCHNDCGMAVANSLAGCHSGVGLIQGTINGIGERTGNADLCSIIPTLALHVQSQLNLSEKQLASLVSTSRYVDEILNRSPQSGAPFVGASAFAHKGGLHVAALERSSLSYQHIEPELVGNEQRILISELSGRQNILGQMKKAGVHLDEDDPSHSNARAVAILNRIKELEAIGYTFEGAEASVHLMILHAASPSYCQPFQVLDYSVQVYDSQMDSVSRVLKPKSGEDTATARATIKVRTISNHVDDDVFDGDDDKLPYQDRLEVGDGAGPVDALTIALKRALRHSHPYLKHIELVDYKVRILDPESATAAATRVMIEFRDRLTDERWTTVSADTNVISASLNAVLDGFEYALIEHSDSCMLCDDFFF